MNPYIIDRPQFNLVDAFSRGREQAQNYRINQQSLAENDYKMAETKRLQQENEKIKHIFGGLLKHSGGNIDQAQKVAVTEFPEYAQVLSRGFAQLRGEMPDPIKQQQDQLKLQTDKNELIGKYGAPLAKQFLSRPQGEQLEGFTDFANQLNQAGIPIPPEWTELGYTPETVAQIQSLAGMEQASQANVPMSVAETEWFNKQTPETQQRHLALKRSAQTVNLGGEQVVLDPITKEITKTFKTTPKPLEEAKLGIQYGELDLKKQENERKVQIANEKAKEFEEKHKTNLFAKKQEVEKIDSFVNELEDLSKRPLGGNYGAGKVARIVPGSTWATTNAKINKLLSSGVLQVMAQLKASSATGSTGFGALSEKEMSVLQSAFSILNDRNIEPEVANQEIKNILDITKKYRDNIKNYKFGETAGSRDPLGLGLIK